MGSANIFSILLESRKSIISWRIGNGPSGRVKVSRLLIRVLGLKISIFSILLGGRALTRSEGRRRDECEISPSNDLYIHLFSCISHGPTATTAELEEHDAKKGSVVSPLRFLQTNETLFERIFSLLLPYKGIEPKLFGGWGRMDLE